MITKPRKGRYFPISWHWVAKITEAWRLFLWQDRRFYGEVIFANPSLKTRRVDIPLVWLSSPHSLTVFSVPDTIAFKSAIVAVETALAICAELSRTWQNPRGYTRHSYIFTLVEPATLAIIKRIVHYKPRKYRGAQKFARLKPRINYAEVRRVFLPGI